MKIAFMASDAVAIPAIESVWKNPKTELVAIVSNPDKPKGRGGKVSPNDVSAWAVSHGVLLLRPEKSPDKDVIEALKNAGAECVVVMAYGRILKEEFLNFAPLGCLNLHGSILPELRGASPIETAIALGKTSTGVSLMRIVKKMDAGDVADVVETEISPRETGKSLREKIGIDAARLLERNFDKIAEKTLAFTPQNEENVTYSRKISKSDLYLDFSKSARELDLRIRAFGCGIVSINGEVLKIGEAFANSGGKNIKFGMVASVSKDRILISCAEGFLNVQKIQAPCAKMLSVSQFLNGYKIDHGVVFDKFENEKLLK